MASDTRNTAEPSITTLVSGIINDAQELIMQQFRLLRAEVQQELRQARNAAISLAIGAGVTALGGLLLIIMLVHLIDYYADIPLWGCYGIVGGLLAAIGVALLLFGGKEAANVELAPPPQTAEAMRENVQWLKGQTTSERT